MRVSIAGSITSHSCALCHLPYCDQHGRQQHSVVGLHSSGGIARCCDELPEGVMFVDAGRSVVPVDLCRSDAFMSVDDRSCQDVMSTVWS